MSSSVIGSLRVNLGLDSAQFERGAKRMDAPLRQMRKQFMAISAVAATTATALAGLTVGVVANAQEIDNFARVANTAPEVFQRSPPPSRAPRSPAIPPEVCFFAVVASR